MTDPLEAKDRNARGQGQGPRTQAQVFSKKKLVFRNFFLAIYRENRCSKNFSGTPQTFNNSKSSAVLEPRTVQFLRTWGFETKAKDLTFEAKDFKMEAKDSTSASDACAKVTSWF